jgi:putative ATP-dependent endonuclease of OLD family
MFPTKHNVFLGPNNSGKTAILEALYLLFNPELSFRSRVVDENDFYGRVYRTRAASTAAQPVAHPAAPTTVDGNSNCLPDLDETGQAEQAKEAHNEGATAPSESEPPIISVEAVLQDLSSTDEDFFRDFLVSWDDVAKRVIDATDEGVDPFNTGKPAICVRFEACYDENEDDFIGRTFFVTDSRAESAELPEFNRKHKRHIGFLIYRDFRGLTRPITLEPSTLFGRLLSSQEVVPRQFDESLSKLSGALDAITSETDFASILNSYKAELEQFLRLSLSQPSALSFELTDRTRAEIKEAAELYVRDECKVPLQKTGAGTRSLAILAILTLIMRRRKRGILALEEPETFLFPHAQRRVVDECLDLADQTFITTHSPYVLERIPAEGVGRLSRTGNGQVDWKMLDFSNVKHLNLYSKRIRQSFCEALLGKGVVVVEGDSDRWWIYGASRIMNRKQWNGRSQEALELQGVSVVSTDANSDLSKTAAFFQEAGLSVVCVADQVKDHAVISDLCNATFATVFLRQAGLEDVLASQLPISVVCTCLTAAPYSRVSLHDAAVIANMTEPTVRSTFRDFMIANKGSAQLHEWLMADLDETSIPAALKDILDIVSEVTNGRMAPCRMSLL